MARGTVIDAPVVGRTGYAVGQMDPALQEVIEADRQRAHALAMQAQQIRMQKKQLASSERLAQQQMLHQKEMQSQQLEYQQAAQLREQAFMRQHTEATQRFQMELERFREERANREYMRDKQTWEDYTKKQEEIYRQHQMLNEYNTNLQMMILTKYSQAMQEQSASQEKLQMEAGNISKQWDALQTIYSQQRKLLESELTTEIRNTLPMLQDATASPQTRMRATMRIPLAITRQLRRITNGKLNVLDDLRNPELLKQLGPQQLAAILAMKDITSAALSEAGIPDSSYGDVIQAFEDAHLTLMKMSTDTGNTDYQPKMAEALNIYNNAGPEAKLSELWKNGQLTDKERMAQYGDELTRRILTAEPALGMLSPQAEQQVRMAAGRAKEAMVQAVRMMFGGQNLSDEEVRNAVSQMSDAVVSPTPPPEVEPILTQIQQSGGNVRTALMTQMRDTLRGVYTQAQEALKTATTPAEKKAALDQIQQVRQQMAMLRRTASAPAPSGNSAKKRTEEPHDEQRPLSTRERKAAFTGGRGGNK